MVELLLVTELGDMINRVCGMQKKTWGVNRLISLGEACVCNVRFLKGLLLKRNLC